MSEVHDDQLPSPGILETVKLETDLGQHVGWARIPTMRPPADILVWGIRHFQLWPYDESGYLRYREGFAVAIVTPVTTDRPPLSETT